MKFLDKLGFKKEEIEDFVSNTPDMVVTKIKESQKLVTANIMFLKELGVQNYKEIFSEYYDMFLMDNSNFIGVFNKYDRDDLIDKLEKNISIVEYL